MSVRRMWRLWALALVVVVLAWLVLQDRLTSVEPEPVRATRQSSGLPALAPQPAPADPAPSLAALSQSTLWGPLPQRASGAASAAEAPPPKWALTGFYERSGRRFVIVSFEQQVQPSQQLQVADKLPDGSRIVRIETDKVRVRRPAPSAPEEGAAAQSFEWIPITPGLPMPGGKRPR